jgi:hypothetical protein
LEWAAAHLCTTPVDRPQADVDLVALSSDDYPRRRRRAAPYFVSLGA